MTYSRHVEMTESPRRTTLVELLKPYNLTRIAEQVGTTKQMTSRWGRGENLPDAKFLPKLAELLRIDLGDLTRIVAADAARINGGEAA
jgi:transcriptional regulator with XRE-family HTH domain